MLTEDSQFLLRDGRPALLRSPREEEAEQMLEYIRQVSGETPFLLREPEDCTDTVEQERAFLRRQREDGNTVMLVCEVDGRIAGVCDMRRMHRRKTAHRATLGIVLRREFWGLGIGTAMFRQLIAHAQTMGVEQMELSYMEGNARGRALYTKMGFRQEAELPNRFLLADGSRRAEVFMVRPVEAGEPNP